MVHAIEERRLDFRILFDQRLCQRAGIARFDRCVFLAGHKQHRGRVCAHEVDRLGLFRLGGFSKCSARRIAVERIEVIRASEADYTLDRTIFNAFAPQPLAVERDHCRVVCACRMPSKDNGVRVAAERGDIGACPGNRSGGVFNHGGEPAGFVETISA